MFEFPTLSFEPADLQAEDIILLLYVPILQYLHAMSYYILLLRDLKRFGEYSFSLLSRDFPNLTHKLCLPYRGIYCVFILFCFYISYTFQVINYIYFSVIFKS